MEKILQCVLGFKMLSFLDGLSGYNQIVVASAYQLKATFWTPRGTFSYRKMHFGFINTGASFQSAMNIVFSDLTNEYVVIYLYDVTAL